MFDILAIKIPMVRSLCVTMKVHNGQVTVWHTSHESTNGQVTLCDILALKLPMARSLCGILAMKLPMVRSLCVTY